MVPFDLARNHPGVILDGCVTAEAAADLTGYNIQHIRRLALAGKLEAVHVSTAVYDELGRIASTTDPAGIKTRYEYDGLGRRVKTIVNDRTGSHSRRTDINVTTSVELDKAGQVVATIDPRGTRIELDRDAAGRPRAIVRPDGTRDWTCYDKAGQVLRAIRNCTYTAGLYTPDTRSEGAWYYNPHTHGPWQDRDLIARSSLDLAERPVEVTDPLGNQSQMMYDKDGLLHTATDPAGVVTRMVYNRARRPRLTVLNYRVESGDGIDDDPANWLWSTGNLRWEDGSGHPIPHDAANDRNVISQVTMDEAGRQTGMLDPRGGLSQTEYDGLDRPRITADPLGYVWERQYAPGGSMQQVTLIDPKTQQTVSHFDRLGRLTSVIYDDEATPDLALSYHRNNALAKVVETGSQTPRQSSYSYDALGRLQGTLFDENGSQWSTSSRVDALGLRTQLTASLGVTATYDHDDLGRLKHLSSWLGSADFRYDGAGRIVSVERENGLRSRYQYDAAGRLVDLRHHAGASTFAQFHYEYDGRGQLAQALEYVPFAGDPGETTTAADATPVKGAWSLVGDFRRSTGAGDLRRVAFVGGAFTNLTLGTGPDHGLCGIYIDDETSLTCVDVVDTRAAETGEVKVTVTLRAEGRKFLYLKNERNRKSMAGTGSVVRFKEMTSPSFADAPALVNYYDALGRLSQTQYPLTYPPQGIVYTRDLAGNVTNRLITGFDPEPTDFAYDAANRLTSVDTQPVSYDDNGNMESDGQQRAFTWDKANRLLQVQQGANTYQHTYNGLGQRIKLTQNGVETRFLLDGQSQWVIGAQDVATQAATGSLSRYIRLLRQLSILWEP